LMLRSFQTRCLTVFPHLSLKHFRVPGTASMIPQITPLLRVAEPSMGESDRLLALLVKLPKLVAPKYKITA
jgi:hypothetical protein